MPPAAAIQINRLKHRTFMIKHRLVNDLAVEALRVHTIRAEPKLKTRGYVGAAAVQMT